ncbi:deoA [Mytilus coruscus]|uniref:Thymidine phosphorylase n=1 Tax=Mytilus coruscus TaxID=42192 RepID=A0A6J8DZK5_MYTCO|nr:deoA [Mytilus coruscus]
MSEPNNNHVKYTIPELIIKKRNGQKLSKEEIECFVQSVVNGHVQESQIGAMLMAMYLKELDVEETTNLTRSMMVSGDMLRWPKDLRGKLVDKHSTGGVGDKISLVLAPALAACGMKVPMISGRGLGHTGGTLDKLEAIPGFIVCIDQTRMQEIIDSVGCCIVGQTKSLVPADKIFYATRDVTGTIDDTSLIAASIISKKAAEQVGALVLDVKCGKGSFNKTETAARKLASKMVDIGNGLGVKTVALITKMDSPIGNAIGNALEVAEAIECLHDNGPDDIMDLVYSLGAQVLHQSCKTLSTQEARHQMIDIISSGAALRKFRDMIIAQGVSKPIADSLCEPGADMFKILPKAQNVTAIICKKEGSVFEIDSLRCAEISGRLGAGRFKSSDSINYAVGLELCVHVGSKVKEGQTWLKIHHDAPLNKELIKNIDSILSVVPPDEVVINGSRIIDVVS